MNSFFTSSSIKHQQFYQYSDEIPILTGSEAISSETIYLKETKGATLSYFCLSKTSFIFNYWNLENAVQQSIVSKRTFSIIPWPKHWKESLRYRNLCKIKNHLSDLHNNLYKIYKIQICKHEFILFQTKASWK